MLFTTTDSNDCLWLPTGVTIVYLYGFVCQEIFEKCYSETVGVSSTSLSYEYNSRSHKNTRKKNSLYFLNQYKDISTNHKDSIHNAPFHLNDIHNLNDNKSINIQIEGIIILSYIIKGLLVLHEIRLHFLLYVFLVL